MIFCCWIMIFSNVGAILIARLKIFIFSSIYHIVLLDCLIFKYSFSICLWNNGRLKSPLHYIFCIFIVKSIDHLHFINWSIQNSIATKSNIYFNYFFFIQNHKFVISPLHYMIFFHFHILCHFSLDSLIYNLLLRYMLSLLILFCLIILVLMLLLLFFRFCNINLYSTSSINFPIINTSFIVLLPFLWAGQDQPLLLHKMHIFEYLLIHILLILFYLY